MALHEFYKADAKYGVKVSDGTVFIEADSLINEIDHTTSAKSLVKGSIAIVDQSGKFIASAASALIAKASSFRFVLGQGDQVAPLLSELIPKLAAVKYLARVAGTNNIQYVGAEDVVANTPVGALSLPAVLVAGTEAYIRVRFTQRRANQNADIYTYNTEVYNGDSALAILTRIVAKINAETVYPITATIIDTDKGIKIETEENVAIGVSGIFEYSSVVTASTTGQVGSATYYNPGVNAIDALQKAETAARSDKGDTDGTSPERYNTWKLASDIDVDKTYNVINVSWPLRPTSIGESTRKASSPRLMIAAEVGTDADVGVGLMTTIIDPILAACFSNGGDIL